MTLKEYQTLYHLKNNYFKNSLNISIEDLLDIYNCDNEDDLYKYVSKEEIETFNEWLKALDEGKTDFIFQKAKEAYTRMTPEEISKNVSEFIKSKIFDKAILDAVTDKTILLDLCDELEGRSLNMLLSTIESDTIINYINEDGKNSEKLLRLIATNTNDEFVKNALDKITSDFNRATLLVYKKDFSLSDCVNDRFFKNQIVYAAHSDNYMINLEDLIGKMRTYQTILSEFSQIEDEKEKAAFVSRLDSNEIKEVLLAQIKDRENRNTVVQSLQRYTDPEIESLDELARTMIIEFYEDTLGDKFTDDKRERLNIVFNRTDVFFEEMEYNLNGEASYIFQTLKISSKHKNSVNFNIGFLIHEYSHLLSNYGYFSVNESPLKTFEEGMADVFSDTVINSYLQKHKQIELDGKRVRLDKPYAIDKYSGYDSENAWARTALAGLESSNKDKEAIIEYTLGSKSKFAEMLFGKERNGIKESENQDFYIPNLVTTREELYHSPNLDYSNIDRNSIYSRGNFILPLFELQNRLQETDVDLVGVLSKGKAYYASFVAKKYFSNRKFYEIPKEELGEFLDLLYAQKSKRNSETAIVSIEDYFNQEISELDENEISENSIEILRNIPVLFGKYDELKAGTTLENVIRTCLENAHLKLQTSCTPEEFVCKKNEIINAYKNLFSEECETNRFIIEYVNDFDFNCDLLLESSKPEQTLSTINPMDALKNALEAGQTTSEEAYKAKTAESRGNNNDYNQK